MFSLPGLSHLFFPVVILIQLPRSLAVLLVEFLYVKTSLARVSEKGLGHLRGSVVFSIPP